MDVVKICEVVNGCEDCPKYGDDCDGDKMTEHTDLINRADAIEAVAQQWLFEASVGNPYVNDDDIGEYRKLAEELFEDVPSADAVPQSEQYKKGFEDAKRAYEIELARSTDAVQGEWISCSEKLPSDDEIVNITWVNHNPPSYYVDIAEKPFVASGLRYRDKWYWYSSVCQDLHQDFDLIDKDIEVIAWQPLPKPYECGARMKGGDNE